MRQLVLVILVAAVVGGSMGALVVLAGRSTPATQAAPPAWGSPVAAPLAPRVLDNLLGPSPQLAPRQDLLPQNLQRPSQDLLPQIAPRPNDTDQQRAVELQQRVQRLEQQQSQQQMCSGLGLC